MTVTQYFKRKANPMGTTQGRQKRGCLGRLAMGLILIVGLPIAFVVVYFNLPNDVVNRWEADRQRASAQTDRDLRASTQRGVEVSVRAQKEAEQATREWEAKVEKATEAVDGLRQAGLVFRIDVDGRKVRVDPLLWLSNDVEEKTMVVQALAVYIGAKAGMSHPGSVTVMSSQNDTIFAERSSFGNVTVHK